jgi:transposase-like protein/5-methylcytosine-specific restriction endonuclease McrA
MKSGASSPWQDQDNLREMYCRDDMTQQKIADELGCSVTTISRWLKKFNLVSKPWRDEGRLRDLLLERGLTVREAAEELGCDRGTIRRWVKNHDLPKRPWRDREVLANLFVEKGLPLKEVADCLGCRPRTVREWVHIHDLPNDFTTYDDPVEVECDWCGQSLTRQPNQAERYDRNFCDMRCFAEFRRNWTGSDNPLFEGGVFPYGEGWTRQKREVVRERDNRECQHCGRTEEEHLRKFGTKHVVHHVVPARMVDDPGERNAMANLITLCRGDCHHTWEKSAPGRPDSVAQAD